jgi:hypothetical protein
MKKLFSLFFLLLFITSCNKKDNGDLIWEKSFSKGEALSITASADSGFAVSGFVSGKPYFVRFDKDRTISLEISAEVQGEFSSFWFDTSGYVTAGNSAGKMLIMRHSPSGNKLWEKTIDAGYRIDVTSLYTRETESSSLLVLPVQILHIQVPQVFCLFHLIQQVLFLHRRILPIQDL